MRAKGFSLPELLLVVGIFSAFLLCIHSLLNSGLSAWRRTASAQDARIELNKAYRRLLEDLRATGLTSCSVSSSAALSTPTQGDVLWLLSAADPSGAELCRKDDGTPFWQRNVLYYLCTPTDHDTIFGMRCQAKAYFCPHKVLVRRVYDLRPVTSPSSPEGSIEELMTVSQVKARALAPRTLSSSFPGPEAEQSEIVATGLLDFSVSKGAEGWSSEIVVRLKAFNADQAGKVARVGQEDLRSSPYTHETLASVFPGN